MAESDISYPKASGQTITSSDMNKVIKAIGTSDADLLDGDRLDIHTQKLELEIQSVDPTAGELREGVLWYLTGGILKYRTSAATRIVANLEEAQTFSGVKTFSATPKTDAIAERTSAAGVEIDGLLIKDEYVEFDAIAAPGTPGSGKGRLYNKTWDDSKEHLAFKNDNGEEYILGEGVFAEKLRNPKSRWVFEAPLNWVDAQAGGAASSPVSRHPMGVQVLGTTESFIYGSFLPLSEILNHSTAEAVLPNGTVLEIVGVLKFTAFSTITDSDRLIGICLQEGNIGGSPGDAFRKGASIQIGHKVTVGSDKLGNIWVLTGNGIAGTSTDTGVDVTAGATVKVHIKWTVGTNVVVTLNDSTVTTVTATLPTRWTVNNIYQPPATTTAADMAAYGFYGKVVVAL